MNSFAAGIACLILCLAAGVATARAQGEPQGLSGTWRSEGASPVVLKLNGDGTGSLGGAPFNYAVLGDKLVIRDGDKVTSYTFKLRGGALALLSEDGRGVVFTREGGGGPAGAAKGAADGPAGDGTPAPRNPLVGRWVSSEGTADVRDDGTLVFNGQALRYRVEGGTITLISDEGEMPLPFRLSGDTLTVSVEGEEIVYRRQKAAAGGGAGRGGANPAELFGKWCYMSNVNSSGGGRMSNRCFTLHPDGTYEYYAETSSSGPVASSASQESDSGTWAATETTITAHSRANGTNTYRLEKRNHPKTGDPMLVLDGDAYVTYAQRPPWP